METDRRLLQANTLVMVGLMALVAVGALVLELQPWATFAGLIGVGAISAVLAIATAEHAPGRRAAVEEPDDGPRLIEQLALELERGRRQECPFTAVRVPLVERTPAGSAGRYLAQSVRATLRTIDLAIPEGDSLYLLLPGSDRLSAEACVGRISEVRPGVFADADVTFATFPDNGVTVSALLGALHGTPPAASIDDLPSLERRRRIVVDLTAVTTPATSVSEGSADAVDA